MFDVVHVAGHSEGVKVSSVSQIEVLRYPGFERDLQRDVARVPPDGRGIMSRCASTLGQERSHIL